MHTENIDFVPHNNLDLSGANWHQTDSFTASDLISTFQGYSQESGSFSTPALEEPINNAEGAGMEFQWDFSESVFTDNFNLANFSDSSSQWKHGDPLTGNVVIDSDSTYFVKEDVFTDSEAVLGLAVFQARERLETFASDEEFLAEMNQAFNLDIAEEEAKALIEDIAGGEVMPTFEIVATSELNNANAAYGEGKIYLAEEFLSENVNSPEVVEGVLLEEIGHYVDQELGGGDSSGDEGDIFAQLVRDETLSEAELNELQAEDDKTTVDINEEIINVELAAPPFSGEDFVYDGQSSVSYNSDVEAWQQRMADRGWDIVVDGKYGSASESIALEFQQAKDLDIDGIVGSQTWEATFDTSTPPFSGEDFVYSGQSSVSYNSDVEAWQQRMLDRGWDIVVDGKYGPASESIALEFQQAKDLDVDGSVGPQTWEASFTTGTPQFSGEDFIYNGQSSVSYNSDVEAWQQQMLDRGWDIVVDGKYGPASESTALQFQEQQGLKVDGIVGSQTWEATFDKNDVSPPNDDSPDEPPEDTPEPTANFRENIVAIAEEEWEFFDGGNLQETEDEAWQRIVEYWETQGINDNFGVDTPEKVGSNDYPWSAVFISWVMDQADIGDKFEYSASHSIYITDAIQDRENNDSEAAFFGYKLNEYSPQVGDLVGYAREEGVDYNTPATYDSHTDIVVDVREGEIDVIGGNVDDSVTKKTLEIDFKGRLIDDSEDWFVVLGNQLDESDNDNSESDDGLLGTADPLYPDYSDQEEITSDPNYSDYSGQITVSSDLNANTKAFLDTISYAEGTYSPDGYRIIFGGDRFESFEDHPRERVPFGDTSSTAAGRYQFLEETWDGIQANLNLSDFSPENQDLAAVELIAGQEAIDEVEAGEFEEAIEAVNDQWASLPGSPYGQPTKSLEELQAVYEANLQKYENA